MDIKTLKVEDLTEEIKKQLASQVDLDKLKELGEIEFNSLLSKEDMEAMLKTFKDEMALENAQNLAKALEHNEETPEVDFVKMKKLFDAVSTKDISKAREIGKELTPGMDSMSDGVLIPTQWTNTVLDRADSYGMLRKYATRIPMSTNKIELHKLTSEPGVIWTLEGETIKKGKPVFGKFALIPAKLSLIIPWTTEFAEDEAIGVFAIIQRIISRQIAKAEDDMMLNGDGTIFTGIFQHPDVNVVSMGAGKTSYNDLTADDLLKITDNILDSEEASSAYFMHRTIRNRVKLIKDGIGTYVFPTNANDIWGYNAITSPLLPAYNTDAPDKKFIGFGDLSNVYYGERRSLTVELLDQAQLTFDGYTVNLAEQDMRALKVTERIGILVAIPEQFTVLKTAAA
ncbi:MAG TPA: phage major capsid protein [Candidatus Atribacteria bacterium]|nr:phage major capsid protein [Candidatus Atribacteria bacterium]